MSQLAKSRENKDAMAPTKMFGYHTVLVERLVQIIQKKVAKNKMSTKINWKAVSTEISKLSIMTPRECQVLWRHVAYANGDHNVDLRTQFDMNAPVDDYDSDIDQPFKEDHEYEF